MRLLSMLEKIFSSFGREPKVKNKSKPRRRARDIRRKKYEEEMWKQIEINAPWDKKEM